MSWHCLKRIVSALTEGSDSECSSSTDELDIIFCVEEVLAAADIEVTVKGVGKLSFPLSKADVQKLINVSTTAKFGMGEETVLDINVRNTQMIVAENLNVIVNQESLSRITSNMQKALNLPVGSILKPHLHNMLIYGPGQFFNRHRDSEKLQNMIATLVIILPSPHIGGDLIIEHGNKKHIFSSENLEEDRVKCICFYSDCIHEVNKIKYGQRVALTFNVALETGEFVTTASTNEELTAAVRDYFNNPNEMNKKIVFFLNHTYSKHSLLWNMLKGEDYQYASKFRSVAQELELDVHLALAEIHQCWQSANEYEREPQDLIDTENCLNFWIDANNAKLPYRKYSIDSDEICFALETDDSNFDRIKEDFSGPTGNAGCIMDYWYKRAAIVLWQKSDSLTVKFDLHYEGALTELRTLISVPGNEGKVKGILDKAAKLLHNYSAKNNFETFANIALYVKSKKEAQAMLAPFRPSVLIPKNVQKLIQLQQHYGIDWLIELVNRWLRVKRYGDYSAMASEAVNPFICEFLNCGGDRSVIEFLLKTEVTIYIESTKWDSSYCFDNGNLEKLRELFKACAALNNSALHEELVQYVTSQPKLFPKKKLFRVYCQLQEILSPENVEKFDFLRARLIETVKQELPKIRRKGDWSISTVSSCGCENCNVLMNFLRSKNNVRMSWSANENIRKHITSILQRSQAPIDITLETNTRPYTIVLVKNAKIHVEAAEECTELRRILKILESKTTLKKKPPLMKKRHDTKRQKL